MKLTILGCFSASPRKNSFPTSQVLDIKGNKILIDCGEGTQIQLRRYGFKLSAIENIFISHLHGDHFFGLPGLISTFRLLGRTKELNIFGPKGIKEAIELLMSLGKSWGNFNLNFVELEEKKAVKLIENDSFSVSTIPLKHRIYTNGFLFTEKNTKKRIKIEEIEKFDIDKSLYNNISLGKDVLLDDGTKILNKDLTYPLEKDIVYSYCSDTAYSNEIIRSVEGSDLLYHESTFLEKHIELAKKTKHSTAIQAAKVAKEANCKRLLLGHFSSRYKNLYDFKLEAETIFENVQLAEEGKVFDIL
tara:strand:- start:2313 stop:3221 length:909 start_codon:yes stop_codon:yes gene_type:complete